MWRLINAHPDQNHACTRFKVFPSIAEKYYGLRSYFLRCGFFLLNEICFLLFTLETSVFYWRVRGIDTHRGVRRTSDQKTGANIIVISPEISREELSGPSDASRFRGNARRGCNDNIITRYVTSYMLRRHVRKTDFPLAPVRVYSPAAAAGPIATIL